MEDKRYVNIPVKELKEVLEGYKFPKELRMNVMKNTLRKFVDLTRQEALTLDNRKNYRLLWFHLYSEYQLNNLFREAQNKKDQSIKDYPNQLISEMIFHLRQNNETQRADKIDKLENKHSGLGNIQIPDLFSYNDELNDLFVDKKSDFDGIAIKNFRPIIYSSATIEEMFELGEKYGVNIPRALNGDDLREYVNGKLKVMGILTPELEKELEEGTITKLKAFAKEKGIFISAKLNKKETIEYLLQRAPQTKETYQLPLNDSVYEMGMPLNEGEDRYFTLYGEYLDLQRELSTNSGNEELEKELSEKQDEIFRLKQALEENKYLEEDKKETTTVEKDNYFIVRDKKQGNADANNINKFLIIMYIITALTISGAIITILVKNL